MSIRETDDPSSTALVTTNFESKKELNHLENRYAMVEFRCPDHANKWLHFNVILNSEQLNGCPIVLPTLNIKNLLADARTGGRANVIGYDTGSYTESRNYDTYQGGPDESWKNNGALIDIQDAHFDFEHSFRRNKDTGSSWKTNHAVDGVGSLMIDLTGVEDECVSISRFFIFQMAESDGAVTSVRFSRHESFKGHKPCWGFEQWDGHNSWHRVTDWIKVGPAEFVDSSASTRAVRVTASWSGPSFNTRFLGIESRNDGSLGNPKFIDIRQIKAFS